MTRDGAPDAAGVTELADLVAAAAMGVPGVAGLHTGTYGQVATYLPGRRVNGVRLREDLAEVHVTLVYGTSVLATAERIRAAVGPLVTTPVAISIEDVVPADAGAAGSGATGVAAADAKDADAGAAPPSSASTPTEP